MFNYKSIFLLVLTFFSSLQTLSASLSKEEIVKFNLSTDTIKETDETSYFTKGQNPFMTFNILSYGPYGQEGEKNKDFLFVFFEESSSISYLELYEIIITVEGKEVIYISEEEINQTFLQEKSNDRYIESVYFDVTSKKLINLFWKVARGRESAIYFIGDNETQKITLKESEKKALRELLSAFEYIVKKNPDRIPIKGGFSPFSSFSSRGDRPLFFLLILSLPFFIIFLKGRSEDSSSPFSLKKGIIGLFSLLLSILLLGRIFSKKPKRSSEYQYKNQNDFHYYKNEDPNYSYRRTRRPDYNGPWDSEDPRRDYYNSNFRRNSNSSFSRRSNNNRYSQRNYNTYDSLDKEYFNGPHSSFSRRRSNNRHSQRDYNNTSDFLDKEYFSSTRSGSSNFFSGAGRMNSGSTSRRGSHASFSGTRSGSSPRTPRR